MRSISARLRSATCAERSHEADDALIRQAVVDELAFAAVGDEAGTPELLEMLRGVADAEAGALGQRLDAALALSEMLEQLEPMRVSKAPRHQRQLFEQAMLRVLTVDIDDPTMSFNNSLE